MFLVLFTMFFLGFSEAILKPLFQESETILFKQFLINFYFNFWVYAPECLKTCVNCVFFQLFFLNLSSKVPAGVRVRTSKYPYNGYLWRLVRSFQKCILFQAKHLMYYKQQFVHCCGIHRSILKLVLTTYLDIVRTIFTADK